MELVSGSRVLGEVRRVGQVFREGHLPGTPPKVSLMTSYLDWLLVGEQASE